jgi:hypothetical protein
MSINNPKAQGSENNLFRKLKEFIDKVFRLPKHSQPAYSINSITSEGQQVFGVEISLTYTYATPSLVNTFTKEEKLMFVKKGESLTFVPKTRLQTNLQDQLLEDCKNHIREEFF